MEQNNNYRTINGTKLVIKKKWYKKWWIILLFAFLLYFFAVSLILTLETPAGEEAAQKLTKNSNLVDESKLYQNSGDDPQIGKQDSKVRIVEFADFQCPYCLEVFGVVREIITKYGDQIHFVYRDFPVLDLHPDAQKAAEAGQCANEQGKFWPMHDKLFINQNDLSLASLERYAEEIGLDIKVFKNCLNSNKYSKEVERDYLDGQILGVKGTPTFFINNFRISGAIPRDIFIGLIKKGLTE